MTNLIVTLLLMAIIIAATVLVSTTSLGAQANMSSALKRSDQITTSIARTAVETLSVNVDSAGDDIEVTVRNSGQEPLRVDGGWDLIFAYDDSSTSTGLQIVRLSYTGNTIPTPGEWVLEGIYMDAANAEAEVFGRQILDAGEEAVINARLASAISDSSTNTVTLATSNGVGLTTQFTN
jgi:hypothetical protein